MVERSPSVGHLSKAVDGAITAIDEALVAQWSNFDHAPGGLWHETRVPGVRWVAYLDGQPVGKACLPLVGSKDTAAIFGVCVQATARGQGVVRTLNELAIELAAGLKMKRVFLHSSDKAINVYRKLWFVDRCTLSIYATRPLHGTQPK